MFRTTGWRLYNHVKFGACRGNSEPFHPVIAPAIQSIKEEIFKDPLVVKNGYIDLHDKPGFDMELIPGIEKKFHYIPNPYEGSMWGYDRPNPRLMQ